MEGYTIKQEGKDQAIIGAIKELNNGSLNMYNFSKLVLENYLFNNKVITPPNLKLALQDIIEKDLQLINTKEEAIKFAEQLAEDCFNIDERRIVFERENSNQLIKYSGEEESVELQKKLDVMKKEINIKNLKEHIYQKLIIPYFEYFKK